MKQPLHVPEAVGRCVVESALAKSNWKIIPRIAGQRCCLTMVILESLTRHSSLRCLLTEQRSTLSVFCCKAVWEMATLKTSWNKTDSVAAWTFVRNRQLTSVEEGSRATLKYLWRTRVRWASGGTAGREGRSSPSRHGDFAPETLTITSQQWSALFY